MMEKDVLDLLRGAVGAGNVLDSQVDRASYAYDATSNWVHEPDVVVFARSAEEIGSVMRIASAHRIPVTPRGGGTNVSGGSVPVNGGIVLVTTRMNRIVSIEPENLTATCECGVILHDLNVALAQKGLFFPPDPQSFFGATIGGIIAENSGGPMGVKYGVVKNYVLGLKVVMPSGKIVNLGGRTVKNVTGYDLPQIVTGSEGTLCVVCEAILKVIPMPSARKTIIAIFGDVQKAGENVSRVFEAGVVPAKIELLDNWVIRSIERINPMGLPTGAEAMLMFELDGDATTVEAQSGAVMETCKSNGAVEIKVAADAAEAANLWKARSAGFAAVFSAAPTVLAEDVTVPRGKIPWFIGRVGEICREAGLEYTVIGHAGDGNLHPSVMTDMKDQAHFARARAAVESIIEAAVSCGGVLSGEHGIGLEKKHFMSRAVEPEALSIMKKIKAVFDPDGIMNPGKMWEDQKLDDGSE